MPTPAKIVSTSSRSRGPLRRRWARLKVHASKIQTLGVRGGPMQEVTQYVLTFSILIVVNTILDSFIRPKPFAVHMQAYRLGI